MSNEMELLTLAEAAELLRVSKPTLRSLIKDGQIDGFAVGDHGLMRIPKSNLMTYIQDGLNKNKTTNKEGVDA